VKIKYVDVHIFGRKFFREISQVVVIQKFAVLVPDDQNFFVCPNFSDLSEHAFCFIAFKIETVVYEKFFHHWPEDLAERMFSLSNNYFQLVRDRFF
jgi:hypothetical protein